MPAGEVKESRQQILDECREPVVFVVTPAMEAEVQRLLAMPAPAPKVLLQDGEAECAGYDGDDDDSSHRSSSSDDDSEPGNGGGFD